jgi:6-pyruvoyltetrahydropterin/6-carboxytetrahydropterin synthase
MNIDPKRKVQPHLGIFSAGRVWKTFKFCAAHNLTGLEDGHKCMGVHGHNYRLTVFCCGTFNTESGKNGMVVDFARIKEVVQPVVDMLDHKNLNEYVEQPTTENVAQWLYFLFKEHLPKLEYVELQETDTCGAQFPAFREYRSHSK